MQATQANQGTATPTLVPVQFRVFRPQSTNPQKSAFSRYPVLLDYNDLEQSLKRMHQM